MAIGRRGELTTVATLCAPVTGETLRRAQTGRHQEHIRPFPSSTGTACHAHEALIDGNPATQALDKHLEIWAKYGFIDGSHRKHYAEHIVHSGDGQSSGDAYSSRGGVGEFIASDQVRRVPRQGAAPGVIFSQHSTSGSSYHGSRTGTGTAFVSSSSTAESEHQSQQATIRPLSPEDGANTPQTIALTPPSEERNPTNNARTAAGQAIIKRANAGLPGPPRDSLAAAIVAATTSAASRAAAVGERARAEGEPQEMTSQELASYDPGNSSELWYPVGSSRLVFDPEIESVWSSSTVLMH